VSARKRPTITDAKCLCAQLRARGVIVIAFHGDMTYAAASYGETKAECKTLGRTLDRIVERLQSGAIPVWDTAYDPPCAKCGHVESDHPRGGACGATARGGLRCGCGGP
jgi:hypothetical protein